MEPKNIIGTLGASIILIAFSLNQTHKLNEDSWSYDFINLIGSVFLVIYAFTIASFPFLVLNLIWAIVSLKDLVSKKTKS
ncbi:hypothetical protein A2Z22_02765 [Candidatus Woesebacteria bacterium RBG_16_34_12]|uniref:CBU-0592-like domain-containing protein n=1 Tax=Candidatus Woesebacteria bacterium RBG_16_34_12 TaxID=1802480 RepID=A0A1F7X6S1_9BACT|nr:MAG: hypothetical protein A2Z22_02765 [Candidatus Woesebacteria bacterium RBG_16_34_12]